MNTLAQFKLDGRVFVVTGASSGIGQALAIFLALAGAKVVVVARRQQQLDELVTRIHGLGGEAKAVAADLSQRHKIAKIAQQCRRQFDCANDGSNGAADGVIDGVVDGVVNAAGINLREPFEDISLDSWDTTLNLNLAVPFFFSREFIEPMQQQGYGRIINIASLQSSRAFANSIPYGASKGGVCQLTRAMAQAWSSSGITCNAIAPGFFPTELTAPVFNDADKKQWAAEQTMIGRNGELSDLSGAIVFFASPASSYITGQTLYVDGGFSAG